MVLLEVYLLIKTNYWPRELYNMTDLPYYLKEIIWGILLADGALIGRHG